MCTTFYDDSNTSLLIFSIDLCFPASRRVFNGRTSPLLTQTKPGGERKREGNAHNIQRKF